MKTYTIPNLKKRFITLSSAVSFTLAMIFTLQTVSWAQPVAPVLLRPANTTVGYPHAANLTWNKVATATSYQVQISTQSDFSSTFLDQSGITDSTKFVSGLSFGTKYYWRVRGISGAGTGSYASAFSFDTWASISAGPGLVDLGEAERFAILAHTAITNVPASAVKGDIGLSPTAGSFIGVTQEQVTGSTFTVDATGPAGSIASAAMLTVAKNNLTAAYNDAAGRTVSPIGLAGNLGGQTLFPGLYKSTGSLEISAGDLTLDAGGNANAVWIFQIASTFNMSSGRQVFLINGANTANIFWQVGAAATFGTTAVMKGTVMAGTQLTFATGATLDGRALALTADVTLQQNTINRPITGVSTSITGTEGWRVLASPYAQVRFSSLLESFWTQGALNSNAPNGTTNIIGYNEVTTGGQNTGFEGVADLKSLMVSGKGYAVFIYSDANGPAIAGNAGFPQTLRTIGNSNGSPFVFPITYTNNALPNEDGWNLVGNPSTVNLNWATATKTNLNANAYVYNPATSAWQIADGNGTGTVSDLIPAYSGFFVKATAAAPVLSVAIAATKTDQVQSDPKPMLTLNAVKGDLASSFSVLFASDAEMGIDMYDAYALTSLADNYINVASQIDEVMLSRQAIPATFEGSVSLPLDIASTLSGDITVTPAFDNIPAEWSLTLVNNTTSERIDLRDVGSFVHVASSPMKVVAVEDRLNNGSPVLKKAENGGANYTLIIESETNTSVEPDIRPALFALEQNFPNPFNPTTMIRFDVANNSNITLQIVDMTGRVVATLVNEVKSPGSYSISWNATENASGMYLLRMQSNNGVLTRKMTLIK